MNQAPHQRDAVAPHADRPPKLRGLALKNDFHVVRELYGETILAELVATLRPAYRAQLAAGFLPSSFYDEAIQADLCAALVARFGAIACVRMGIAAGHLTVNRWHRFLSRIVGPERLLVRTPGLWRYWRDTGAMRIAHQTAASVDIVVEGNRVFGAPGNAECFGAGAAYMVGVAGGRNVALAVEREPNSDGVRGLVRWNDAAREGDPARWFDIDAIQATLPAAYGATTKKKREK